MMTVDIGIYMQLIASFLRDEISARDLQRQYIEAFQRETRTLGPELFLVLDKLFGDLDSFVADGESFSELDAQTPGFYLDESMLRKNVATTNQQLLSILDKTS